MKYSSKRNTFFTEDRTKIMLIVFFAMQPMLDILSYFMDSSSLGIISSVTRMALLGVMFIVTYFLTDSKRSFITMNILMLLFLLFHMAGNWIDGYTSIYNDLTMYSRIYHLPLYIYFFCSGIGKIEKSNRNIFVFKLLVMNLLIITLSILLSYIVKQPSYTYYAKEIGYYGIKGWFAVANSQSAIVSLLSCTTIAYSVFTFERNSIAKIGLMIVSVGSLFLFGTKLSFYTIFLFYSALLVLMIIGRRITIKSLILIVIPLVLVYSVKDYSYANLNTKFTNTSIDEWQEIIDEVDPSTKPNVEENGSVERPKIIDKNYYLNHKEEYFKIYNLYMEDLVSEFGLDKVVEKYNYSLDAYVLINNRDMKLNAASLAFSEGSTLKMLFGMEQSDYIVNGENYDVENDFHGMYFSYGFVGLFVFPVFMLYILIRGGIHYLLNKDKRFDMYLGVFLVCFVLVVGAAHYSGHVIKKPNVLFYVCLMISMILLNSAPIRTTIRNIRKEVK